MGAAILVPRSIFFGCGRWDDSYVFRGEDIELSARIGRRYRIVFHPAAEITHYGRVSTRLNLTYSMPNVAFGFCALPRQSGVSPQPCFSTSWR